MTTMISSRRASGFAALYLAAALVAAMLYFLVGTNMPSVTDPGEQVQLLVDHQLGLHLMYLIAYVAFGLVLAVLALGLHERLAGIAPATSRMAAAVGLIWSGVLVASGMVFIVGMNSVVDLNTTDPAAAVVAWQAIYPVTLGLGGAGGEVLGGTWLLLVSLVALRGTRAADLAELVWARRRRRGDHLGSAGSGCRHGGVRAADHRLVGRCSASPCCGSARPASKHAPTAPLVDAAR